MSAQYPRANAFEEPVEDQPYAASWASLSQHGEIAASRVVPTHTPTDQEQPSYQSIPSTVQYSYQPQWPILDQPLGNYGGLAVEHGFQPQLLPSQQTLNSQYGPPVFNRSSQLHTASLQQSLGDHTGVIAFGHSPFRQPPAPQQQLYAYNHPTTGTASGLQAMPSAQTPSYYSSGLAVADIFGAQPLPYGSHERPLSDQEFPNHTASQFVGRHDSAAGSQLSPISNTFHPNPSPTQNQVPVPEDTYDPEWFQKSGIDESVLDDFPGRMKMIHLFYHGIMVKNDCLQLDVECPLREGRCTLTASFHFDGHCSPKGLSFNFSVPYTNFSDHLPDVNGFGTIVEFLKNKGITGKSVNERSMPNDMHLFRGVKDLGSITFAKKAYACWADRKRRGL